MPLPPIPTQAADKVNISRQPKADLKKRPKRIEVEEVEEVTELAEDQNLLASHHHEKPNLLLHALYAS